MASPLQTRLSDVPLDPKELGHIPGFKRVKLVGLEEAVQSILQDEEIRGVLNPDLDEDATECVKWAKRYKKRKPDDPLSVEQVAAIRMYTLEYCGGDGRRNFYSVFNSYMSEPNRPRVKPFLLYLKLLGSALTRLPKVKDVTLYRGIDKPLCALAKYQDHAEFTWWGVSSCSRTPGVVEAFAGAHGTVFSVKCSSAVSIGAYSMCQGEDELLLLPGTLFSVYHRVPQLSANSVGHVVVQEEEESFLWAMTPPKEEKQKETKEPASGKTVYELALKCGAPLDQRRQLLAAHQLGYAPAAVKLRRHFIGMGNVEAKKWEARIDVHALQALADAGDVNAVVQLGACYCFGLGVVQDLTEALKWVKLAADQGHAAGQYTLGVVYDTMESFKEAACLYKLAADQGHATAQLNLGVCYEHGTGVAKNPEEAARLYKLAADQGHAGAQCNLGSCYEHGTGVAENPEEAARLYKLAADQGHARAQCNLGVCYEYGTGVAKNPEEAARLYKLAADQGLDRACRLLQRMTA